MIEIRDLYKSFGALSVLSGIDLTIGGGVTAVLGHNGSGKTTLIKILLGLVKADQGRIVVAGETVNGDPGYKRAIGYMPQAARFPDNLAVGDVFALVRSVRGGDEPQDDDLIRAFRLEREWSKKVRTLSGGTRQKVSAALAFLYRPQILILDEPTAGLDPVASGILKDKIRAERARGCAIILTSHVMSEVQELADQLVFLQDGIIHYNGALSAMIDRTGEAQLERAVARLMEGASA